MHLPERSVDSLLAVEVIRHQPSALLWSPTNTPDSVDHVFATGPVAVAVFEVKGVGGVLASGQWTTKFLCEQARQHEKRASHPTPLTVHYLFVTRPTPRGPCPPVCGCPTCGGGPCAYCCPKTDGRTALASAAVVDDVFAVQPWFCHWSWVISASDLVAEFCGASTEEPSIRLEDVRFSALASSHSSVERLCHFLEVSGASAGSLPFLVLPDEAAPLAAALTDLSPTTTVVLIPVP